MKKNCYLFVFDGFSDWETSYATVGISKSNRFHLKTIALEKKLIRSMGGLSVFPDQDFIPLVDLDDINPFTTAMVILPGGAAWDNNRNDEVMPLVRHCFENDIPIAAIGGATTFLAQQGFLFEFDEASSIIANSAMPIEFAKDVFDRLEIMNEEAVRNWFRYFEGDYLLKLSL